MLLFIAVGKRHHVFAKVAQSVEQRFRKPQVKGSSPFFGSTRGVAQFGSAFGSGPKGRRFKSCHLDQKTCGIENQSHRFFIVLMLPGIPSSRIVSGQSGLCLFSKGFQEYGHDRSEAFQSSFTSLPCNLSASVEGHGCSGDRQVSSSGQFLSIWSAAVLTERVLPAVSRTVSPIRCTSSG